MQYTVSSQQLAAMPLPGAYDLYRQTVADELLAPFMTHLRREPWPSAAGTRSTALEQYALRWLDARSRELPAGRWPSTRVDGLDPRVLDLYKCALVDAECAVDAALRAYALALCRVHIAQSMFREPLPPRDADVEMRSVDGPPPPVVGAAALLRIQAHALVITGLPHTRRALEELVRPPPGDLVPYAGEDALKMPTVPNLLWPAMVRDMQDVFGAALKGAPPKMETPLAVVSHLLDQEDAALVELEAALTERYPRVLRTLAVVTQYELDTVLPRYTAQLEETWGDLAEAFASLLADAESLDQLERMFGEEVQRRAEHTLTVLESYRHQAPVLAPDCGDQIKCLPQTRDTSLLLATPVGVHVMRLTQVLRAVMPSKSGALSKFYSEMPRGLSLAMTGPGFVVERAIPADTPVSTRPAGGAGPLTRRVEPMDMVADYFYRAVNTDPFVGTAVNGAMRDRYLALRRQADMTAQEREAVRAARDLDRLARQADRDRLDAERQARAIVDRERRESERERVERERVEREQRRQEQEQRRLAREKEARERRDRLEAEAKARGLTNAAEKAAREQRRAEEKAARDAERAQEKRERAIDKARREAEARAKALLAAEARALADRRREEDRVARAADKARKDEAAALKAELAAIDKATRDAAALESKTVREARAAAESASRIATRARQLELSERESREKAERKRVLDEAEIENRYQEQLRRAEEEDARLEEEQTRRLDAYERQLRLEEFDRELNAQRDAQKSAKLAAKLEAERIHADLELDKAKLRADVDMRIAEANLHAKVQLDAAEMNLRVAQHNTEVDRLKQAGLIVDAAAKD